MLENQLDQYAHQNIHIGKKNRWAIFGCKWAFSRNMTGWDKCANGQENEAESVQELDRITNNCKRVDKEIKVGSAQFSRKYAISI